MTKNQFCGLLVVTVQCACSADLANNSPSAAAMSEQMASVRAELLNSAVPTDEQLTAFQTLKSHNSFINSDVPFESWRFFAVIADGQNSRLAHHARISRLTIRDDKKASPVSLWDFKDVFVLESELVDFDSAKRQSHQQIERAALGLSGTDSDAQTVWVGSTSIAKVSRLDDKAQPLSADKECGARYTLHIPNSEKSIHKIDALQLHCRDASVLRSAVQSSSTSMLATLTVDSSDKKRVGRAWLVQNWGWPVSTDNAAVVFDRAWLVLNDQFEIQLQQTKRRSGKGPKTASAKLWPIKASAPTPSGKDLTVTWSTNHSGSAISWHITADNPRIDIVVKQAVKTSLSPDARWFGPVTFSGTHHGLGFMDYQPL